MDQAHRRNITLIGFSFTGKSTIARKVAAALGWKSIDTDEKIVELAGKPIPAIFSEDGEEHFRHLERRALEEALVGEGRVIATGGGAVLREDSRELMQRQSVVVCLEARPETILGRLSAESEGESGVVRPLLAGEDPLSRIRFLKEHRQPYYAVADWTIHTDTLSRDEVVEEVVRSWRYLSRRSESHATAARHALESNITAASKNQAREADAPYCEMGGAACVVRTTSTTYPIFIGWDAIDDLGRRMRNAGLKGAAHLISDDRVFPQWGPKVEEVLREAGFDVGTYAVPAGEASKTLESASRIYDWLVQRRAERGQAIVALGGGVVGDLAGFVAATFLRGVPFVQVPTTLLAMVDSSIGGKTAVDHPAGKNLIGAFYQPRLVLADVRTLTTLPRREVVSGWAEVVKHALILDSRLFDRLESCGDELLKLDPDFASEVISRSAAIKGDVVSQDERETGLRTILNYGHTIGHAIEAATAFRYLHGEAVSIGMMGAAMISYGLGLISSDIVARQRLLLQKLGLPTSYRDAGLAELASAIALDKKVSGKAVRWVLLEGIGKAVTRNDVPSDLVGRILIQLRAD